MQAKQAATVNVAKASSIRERSANIPRCLGPATVLLAVSLAAMACSQPAPNSSANPRVDGSRGASSHPSDHGAGPVTSVKDDPFLVQLLQDPESVSAQLRGTAASWRALMEGRLLDVLDTADPAGAWLRQVAEREAAETLIALGRLSTVAHDQFFTMRSRLADAPSGADHRPPEPAPEPEPEPTTKAGHENRPSEPTTGTVHRNRLPEPTTGTVHRNRLPEPTTKTGYRNRLPEPATKTGHENRPRKPATNTGPPEPAPTEIGHENRLPEPATRAGALKIEAKVAEAWRAFRSRGGTLLEYEKQLLSRRHESESSLKTWTTISPQAYFQAGATRLRREATIEPVFDGFVLKFWDGPIESPDSLPRPPNKLEGKGVPMAKALGYPDRLVGRDLESQAVRRLLRGEKSDCPEALGLLQRVVDHRHPDRLGPRNRPRLLVHLAWASMCAGRYPTALGAIRSAARAFPPAEPLASLIQRMAVTAVMLRGSGGDLQ